MNTFFLKILLIPMLFFGNAKNAHPIFMSVTEINHNEKTKSIEISCKIFTDDFEKTLRKQYKTKIDLTNEKLVATMGKYVNDYVQKHLQIFADAKATSIKYVGYEKIDEAIYAHFEILQIPILNTITIHNKILYEYSTSQISLLNVVVKGKRQTTKLVNPDYIATLKF